MKLIWHKRAEKHLFNSAAYTTREFGKATADSFLKDVFRQAALLCNHPQLGTVEPSLVSKHAHEYRSLGTFIFQTDLLHQRSKRKNHNNKLLGRSQKSPTFD